MKDAAQIYTDRAAEATRAGDSCAGGFNTCEGFVVGDASAAPMKSQRRRRDPS
jgi:hypothetical protein